jgi:uncharacterized membrane protein YfcA
MMSATDHSIAWLLEIAAAGFGGGVIGAISGLGGGIVLVPVLTVFLKIPIDDAIAASIVSIIATSSGAGSVYVRDRITNIRIAMFLELFTASGALVGAGLLAGHVSPRILDILFALVLLLSLIPVFAKLGEELPPPMPSDRTAKFLRLDSEYFDKKLHRKVPYNVTGVPAATLIMFAAGAISGTLGIGAGVVKVLAQEIAMKLPTKVSTATSNFMIGVTAAAGAGVYLRRGLVLPYLVVPVAVSVVLGALFGTILMERMSSTMIRKIFALAMGIIGIQMFLRGLGLGL